MYLSVPWLEQSRSLGLSRAKTGFYHTTQQHKMTIYHVYWVTHNMNVQATGRGSALAPGAKSFQPGAQSFDPEQLYRQYGRYQQESHGQYYNQQHEFNGDYAQYMQQDYGQQQLHNPSFAPQQQQQPQQQQVLIIDKATSPSTTKIREAKQEADTVAKEQAAHVGEELLEEVYGKEHVNLLFIGHVEASKTTLGGSVLYATGMLDERTMEKYRRESKEAGKSFFGPFISFATFARDMVPCERKSADAQMLRSRNISTFIGFRSKDKTVE
ncbi:MAG: hypothetical protein Q9217_004064 [Psora testacea]